MMEPDAMDELIRTLIKRGYAPDKAEDYAARLGDCIETNSAGLWLIRDDHGNIIDRIRPIEEEL